MHERWKNKIKLKRNRKEITIISEMYHLTHSTTIEISQNIHILLLYTYPLCFESDFSHVTLESNHNGIVNIVSYDIEMNVRPL